MKKKSKNTVTNLVFEGIGIDFQYECFSNPKLTVTFVGNRYTSSNNEFMKINQSISNHEKKIDSYHNELVDINNIIANNKNDLNIISVDLQTIIKKFIKLKNFLKNYDFEYFLNIFIFYIIFRKKMK